MTDRDKRLDDIDYIVKTDHERIGTLSGQVKDYHQRLNQFEHWKIEHNEATKGRTKEIEEIKTNMKDLVIKFTEVRDFVNSFKGSLAVWSSLSALVGSAIGALVVGIFLKSL